MSMLMMDSLQINKDLHGHVLMLSIFWQQGMLFFALGSCVIRGYMASR